MLVFGHAGYPVILFPTSMGSYHENKDMGLIESAKWYVEQVKGARKTHKISIDNFLVTK
jgi:esterase/lipase superfamily enzyme